jgi:threonine dehydrogenase-like Zn-dependent dehydrogenase
MSPHASLARVDIAERRCVKVTESHPPEAAVFARLMTVRIATARPSRPRPGDRAAVVGLGLVGALAAPALARLGRRP